jgi:predicted ATPase
MATKIKIRNVGPIKEAIFDRNKINVFMGPQSSGKSTIAKIISYCTWVEKDVATSQSLKTYQDNKDYFIKRLESFHKLGKYFEADAYIFYKSDVIELEYKDGKFSIKWIDQYAYKRSKISYIPSERNMVILPEVRKVEFGNTNIRSFLFDWFDAQRNYTKPEKLSILKLVDYYYDENSDKDHIIKIHNGDSYDILLANASSGLQSITPLITTIDYLTNWFYKQEENISSELNERKIQTTQLLSEELILKKYFGNREIGKNETDEINEKIRNEDEQVRTLVAEWRKIEKNLFSTHNAQFIIEEPEQNLFPSTQRDLVYYLLQQCVDNPRDHSLTITTHSPYVLYALNNCMMGKLVFDKMDEEDKNSIACKSALINPKEVSIYQINNAGILEPIQQEDGLIGSNYFDENMKDIMDDFYTFLKYYDDEEE